MTAEIQTTSEPILPPPDTWEQGLHEGHELALKIVETFDGHKKLLKINAEDREGGGATAEEIKLAVGLLVARRMVLELKADLMFNTMAVSRARNYMASHPLIPKHEKERVMAALQIKEGMGVRLSTSWRIMELTCKQWMKKSFWYPGRDPAKEAHNLFLAINGLEQVRQPTEVRSDNEDESKQGEGSGRGLAEAVRGSTSEDQAGGQGQDPQGEGSVPPPEGAGRGPGTPDGQDQGVQGVQEAPGQEDQGDQREDRGPAS